MKRRHFITLLGGAAAAWPLAYRPNLGLFARACARHGVLVVGARLSAIGRQKHARATSQPFRRAAGVLRPVLALTTKTP